MTYDWSIFRLAVFINTGTSAEIPSACLITVFSKKEWNINQYPVVIMLSSFRTVSIFIVNIYQLFVWSSFLRSHLRSNANVRNCWPWNKFHFFVTVAYFCGPYSVVSTDQVDFFLILFFFKQVFSQEVMESVNKEQTTILYIDLIICSILYD